MQNNQTNVRGYTPQNTGRMNTLPYQPQQEETFGFKAIWQQIDPYALALLVAAVLGLAYALYASISFWWLTKIILHLILAWAAVGVNAYALITRKQPMMLLAAVCYLVAMLLFINYCYLLIPQLILCAVAWWNANE